MCLLCLFILSACSNNQTARNLWKGTKSYYYKYLNTPTQLEMEKADFSDYEIYLGSSMYDIEQQLRLLQRVMDDSDRNPDMNWVNSTLRRFPWLGGVAIINPLGVPMALVPEYALKQFDATPLLESVKGQRTTQLRSYIQKSPLGPEVYLGKPVYVDDELQAMVVVHFDMRALLSYAKNPNIVAIVSDDVVLWPGVYDIDETPLVGQDWKRLTSKSVLGKVKNHNGEFYWNSSYFANTPLVFAIASSGEFPLKPEQLEELVNLGALAVQPANVLPSILTPGEAGAITNSSQIDE